jgi:hypothetical protein
MRRRPAGRECVVILAAEAIPLVVAGVVCPVAAFGTNILIRWQRGIVQSSAADLLLLLLTFDAGVAIQADQFKPLVADNVLRESIIPIYIAFIFVLFPAWLLAVVVFEVRIVEAFDADLGEYHSGFPLGLWLSAWSIASGAVFFHILFFVGEPSTWSTSS